MAKNGGVPCVTPEHAVYSSGLGSYLLPEDFFAASRPLCKLLVEPEVFRWLKVPKLGQNLGTASQVLCVRAASP